VQKENERLTERLAAARRQGLPWHHLGRLLQDRFAGSQNWSRRIEVWEPAGAAAGLKPVVLKRFLVLMNKIDEVSRDTGVPAAELVSTSYGAVELALRIYDRDPEAGMSALSDLRERRVTIEELQRRLLETPAGSADPTAISRSLSLRERSLLIQRCEEALTREAGKIFGPGSTVARRPPLKHFHRVGFEISAAGRINGGADLYLPDAATGSKDQPHGLAQSLLLAAYLPNFHLVFTPTTTGAAMQAAAGALDVLKMPHIGILVIDGAGNVVETRPAKPHGAMRIEDYEQIKIALALRYRK
jgi:hypothetical protein